MVGRRPADCEMRFDALAVPVHLADRERFSALFRKVVLLRTGSGGSFRSASSSWQTADRRSDPMSTDSSLPASKRLAMRWVCTRSLLQ
jgi:hypothetical protein